MHQGLRVVENARLFALLNMAGADAYIACWQAKYRILTGGRSRPFVTLTARATMG
jgi:hypothetical protein